MSIATINAQGQDKKAGNAKQKNATLSNEELAKKCTDKMIQKFAFPQDLSANIYPVNLEHISSVRKAKATSPPDKAALNAAHQKHRAGIQSALTPEQFAKVKKAWDEAKAEKKAEKGKATDDSDGSELED